MVDRVLQPPLSQNRLRLVFGQPCRRDLLGHLQVRNDAGEDVQINCGLR